jgi:hypothetical protein
MRVPVPRVRGRCHRPVERPSRLRQRVRNPDSAHRTGQISPSSTAAPTRSAPRWIESRIRADGLILDFSTRRENPFEEHCIRAGRSHRVRRATNSRHKATKASDAALRNSPPIKLIAMKIRHAIARATSQVDNRIIVGCICEFSRGSWSHQQASTSSATASAPPAPANAFPITFKREPANQPPSGTLSAVSPEAYRLAAPAPSDPSCMVARRTSDAMQHALWLRKTVVERVNHRWH